MVDMWGLPDSASLESITHNGRNSGAISDLKLLSGVFASNHATHNPLSDARFWLLD